MRREQIPIIRPPKKPIRINGPHSGQTFCLQASPPPAPSAGRWIQLQPPSRGYLRRGNSIAADANTRGNAIDAMFERGERKKKKKKERSAIREFGTEVCSEVVRKWATRKDACIRVRKARARGCLLDRQPSCGTDPPAASVADKLHGLAGTSGARVALSIQDRAH